MLSGTGIVLGRQEQALPVPSCSRNSSWMMDRLNVIQERMGHPVLRTLFENKTLSCHVWKAIFPSEVILSLVVGSCMKLGG